MMIKHAMKCKPSPFPCHPFLNVHVCSPIGAAYSVLNVQYTCNRERACGPRCVDIGRMHVREFCARSSRRRPPGLAASRYTKRDGFTGYVFNAQSLYDDSALTVIFSDDAESLVRCSPGEDATNGFFVSLFVRKQESATGKRKAAEEEQTDAVPEPSAKRRKKKKKANTS